MRISDWSSDVCSSDLISGVGKVGIGHDRRRVGVDEDNAIALLLERLDRLRPRIVELARLTDNDRAGADDEDGLDVGSFGHLRGQTYDKLNNVQSCQKSCYGRVIE